MKIIKQITILFLIAGFGEILSKTFNLIIPGNVIGMALLFFLLVAKIIKEDDIATVSDFLVANLAFFFLPGLVAILSEYNYLKGNFLVFILICIFIAIIIIASTGLSAQIIESFIAKSKKN